MRASKIEREKERLKQESIRGRKIMSSNYGPSTFNLANFLLKLRPAQECCFILKLFPAVTFFLLIFFSMHLHAWKFPLRFFDRSASVFSCGFQHPLIPIPFSFLFSFWSKIHPRAHDFVQRSVNQAIYQLLCHRMNGIFWSEFTAPI